MNTNALHVRRPRRPHAAFTLVEVTITIAIAAIAGSALLLGATASIQTTDEAMQRTIADGIARQLIDEILGNRYAAPGTGGHDVTLGPSAWESSGSGRERYNDIDDYNAVRIAPPEDPYGIALGKDDGEGGLRHLNFQAPADFLENWRQEVDVYYVRESDLTTRLPLGQTTDYRVVEVRVYRNDPTGGDRELARLRRVIAYVPPM